MSLNKYYVATLILLLGSCASPPESAARFCDRSDYTSVVDRALGREYIDIDLEDGRVYASDTSEEIELVQNSELIGMAEPIPLLIPRLGSGAFSAGSTRISHGRYELVFRPVNSGDDEFIGDVYERLLEGGQAHVLTYTYSRELAVSEFLLRVRTRDSSYEQVFVHCGGAGLFIQSSSEPPL